MGAIKSVQRFVQDYEEIAGTVRAGSGRTVRTDRNVIL
jgi:hypothetical protein